MNPREASQGVVSHSYSRPTMSNQAVSDLKVAAQSTTGNPNSRITSVIGVEKIPFRTSKSYNKFVNRPILD